MNAVPLRRIGDWAGRQCVNNALLARPEHLQRVSLDPRPRSALERWAAAFQEAQRTPCAKLPQGSRIPVMGPNSKEALVRRRERATLTWHGPALALSARTALAVGAQGVVAAVFALRSSAAPWHDAEPWLPVYGTLIDAACLLLLWRLTRRESIRLFDLVGFERTRLARDVLLGLVLIPPSLVFILGGVYAAGWLLYGALTQPYLFAPLPWPAALYGALVFPFIWGLTEQMTYNGYLVARIQVLCRSTALAVAIVALVWSLQHAFMPLTFDERYMAFRLLSSVPFSVFVTLMYLRLRRLVPLVIAHALMDGASVLIGVLLPLVRA